MANGSIGNVQETVLGAVLKMIPLSVQCAPTWVSKQEDHGADPGSVPAPPVSKRRSRGRRNRSCRSRVGLRESPRCIPQRGWHLRKTVSTCQRRLLLSREFTAQGTFGDAPRRVQLSRFEGRMLPASNGRDQGSSYPSYTGQTL